MNINKKVEKLIALGVKHISIPKEDYNNLNEETKKLAILNDVEIKEVVE